MFPIRDLRKTSRFPFVNVFIIILNILIFLLELSVPDIETFLYSFGFVPQRFSTNPLGEFSNIFSSMWLHGGWLHIFSNMWFLHIFGDNVEDVLGHIKYLFFYLFTGAVSVLFQYTFNPLSSIPLIGASGAISGVTGAYFVLFKNSRIEAIVPTFFGFWDIISLPAWFFLGYWFVVQVFSGTASLAEISRNGGGVAFFAHIGGFLSGYFIAKKIKKKSV